MRASLINRRRFMIGAAAAGAAGAAGLYLYARGTDMEAYDQMVAAQRVPLAPGQDMREFVRYATLAANSHNTQPWRFRIGDRRIDVLPDLSRQTPVVDLDDHHLFATLGCATENLLIAAAARGLRGTAKFVPANEGSVAITFEPSAPTETPAFAAIPVRGMSRATYDGRPLAAAAVAELEAAARSDAVDIIMITDQPRIERILSLVVEGNTDQFTDPAFMAELKKWVRFDAAEAIRTGDGLFTGATGNPSVPPWLGRLIFNFVAGARSEADKCTEQIRSSAGIAVFVSKTADKAHWVEAGRSHQRFGLAATTLGLRHAFINQAVEVPSVRDKLAAELGMPGRRPDLIVRFGNGPAMPKSLRRPVAAVLA